MKIWHVGASASPKRVSGLNMSAWVMAREQAKLGHQVTFVVHSPPDQAGEQAAKAGGFELLHLPNTWRYDPQAVAQRLRQNPPDVAHMHSVFQMRQAMLARQFRQHNVPYVIKPAGGLLPEVLKRGYWQKLFYSWVLERPRFHNAAAIAVVTPGEERPVRAFVPSYGGIVRWMPNPVDIESLQGQRWQGPEAKRVVYLGRFDVLHKGIDLLVAIARFAPEVEFHLYGTEDAKTKAWLDELKQDLPANVQFHRPVYGPDKFRVLAEASLYIQPARWEVFGISIAEAMYLGTPCAVAETINFAELFEQHDLGLVLPPDADAAAARLTSLLNDSEQLQHWSQQGQLFAETHFHPQSVAKNYSRLYQDVAV